MISLSLSLSLYVCLSVCAGVCVNTDTYTYSNIRHSPVSILLQSASLFSEPLNLVGIV